MDSHGRWPADPGEPTGIRPLGGRAHRCRRRKLVDVVGPEREDTPGDGGHPGLRKRLLGSQKW